jgi:hypothetical protein
MRRFVTYYWKNWGKIVDKPRLTKLGLFLLWNYVENAKRCKSPTVRIFAKHKWEIKDLILTLE